jgi:hypothetical protein
MRRWFALVVIAVVVAGGACATTKHHHHKNKHKPPSPDDMEDAQDAAPKDTHFDEVRKAAAEQLQCPIEKINVVCLRRDADGECISIRADGCDKSYEYQFGDV